MTITPLAYAHVRLTVTDIDRSRAFYDQVFGLPVAYEVPPDADEATRQQLGFLYGGVIYQLGDSLLGLRPVGTDAFHDRGSGERPREHRQRNFQGRRALGRGRRTGVPSRPAVNGGYCGKKGFLLAESGAGRQAGGSPTRMPPAARRKPFSMRPHLSYASGSSCTYCGSGRAAASRTGCFRERRRFFCAQVHCLQ